MIQETTSVEDKRIAVFVLTYEYSDKSAFNVCGITLNYEVAMAWLNASEDTNVYDLSVPSMPEPWTKGKRGWRSMQIDSTHCMKGNTL